MLSSPTVAFAPATMRISPRSMIAFEVEGDGMAEDRVDLAGGDETLDLVARRVERLRCEAAIRQQRGELDVPVGAREGCVLDAGKSSHDCRSVVAGLGVEHPVDVPERRVRLDQTHRIDRLAQERVRRGLDRTGRVGFDQGLQEDRGPRARARIDRERVDADLGVAEVEVVDRLAGGRETDAQLGERPLGVDEDDGAARGRGVVDEVPGHHRALAAALATDERVAVLAVARRRSRPGRARPA